MILFVTLPGIHDSDSFVEGYVGIARGLRVGGSIAWAITMFSADFTISNQSNDTRLVISGRKRTNAKFPAHFILSAFQLGCEALLCP